MGLNDWRKNLKRKLEDVLDTGTFKVSSPAVRKDMSAAVVTAGVVDDVLIEYPWRYETIEKREKKRGRKRIYL